MVHSLNKGKRFERQVSQILSEMLSVEVRRSQQYCGKAGDADLVGVPGISIECKAVESLNLEKAYNQATSDAKDGDIPVVIHKKNRGKIMISFALDDLIDVVRLVQALRG